MVTVGIVLVTGVALLLLLATTLFANLLHGSTQAASSSARATSCVVLTIWRISSTSSTISGTTISGKNSSGW